MKPMLLLIGLGNPGASYARTRHNTGFRAIDQLSDAFGEGEWKEKQKFLSYVQEGRVVASPVLLMKPQTYMNRSGEAVRKILEFYKLDPQEQILIFCDDVDLPLGQVRLRRRGGPGTHNGLKSIVEVVGENFLRIRIGVGAPTTMGDLANWILSVPSEEEEKKLRKVFTMLPDMVKHYMLSTKS